MHCIVWRAFWLLVIGLLLARESAAQVLTLPPEKRPEWLQREGLVIAGSWEPLLYRARRDSGPDSNNRQFAGTAPRYTPTEEELRNYQDEHTPRMIQQLKEMGVNCVMIHGHKGAGMVAERESMEDAVRFSRLCHDAGLRVGAYVDSGTLLNDFIFQEQPQARNWVVLDREARPIPYLKSHYRSFVDRNHPEVQEYYRKITRFAVESIEVDLLHYDNYIVGPGWDVNSVERFQRYLQRTFPADTLRQHGIDAATVRPPVGVTGLLNRAWQDFCCQSLSDSYHDMSIYARSLRPDVLVDCNPGGVRSDLKMPVDHGRLCTGGDAVWDESTSIGFAKGRLQSHIRTCKVARSMGNMVITYTTTPLEAAESMAFNHDCLGVICCFEYARINARPQGNHGVSPGLLRSVKFFNERRELFRDAKVVADLAVLRSFPSMAFGRTATAAMTGEIEDLLILNRSCFQILHSHQLDRLKQYRGLVLAGCIALSDAEVETIRQFVASGGRLCVIGPLATHDQWMLPRAHPALDDLPSERVRLATTDEQRLSATAWAAGGTGSLSVEGGQDGALPGLCAELTEQQGRRMIHLVNFRSSAVKGVRVRLALPAGHSVQDVKLASPEHESDIAVPFDQSKDEVTFTVPEVGVYEIAVVKLKS